METELYFVYAVLFFAAIVLGMGVEHFIEDHHFPGRTAMRFLRRFERKHPGMCDTKDVFYSFFRRDTFHTK